MNIVRFPDRAAGVVPQRLAEARIARQLSRNDVARELGMTGTTIGYYENGTRTPEMPTLIAMSGILRQPVSFFFKEVSLNISKKRIRFFRSIGPKSNKLNMALDVRTNWLWEFVQVLLDAGIRLPTPDIPLFQDVHATEAGYSLPQIEYLA